jgi:hypothetical protein
MSCTVSAAALAKSYLHIGWHPAFELSGTFSRWIRIRRRIRCRNGQRLPIVPPDQRGRRTRPAAAGSSGCRRGTAGRQHRELPAQHSLRTGGGSGSARYRSQWACAVHATGAVIRALGASVQRATGSSARGEVRWGRWAGDGGAAKPWTGCFRRVQGVFAVPPGRWRAIVCPKDPPIGVVGALNVTAAAACDTFAYIARVFIPRVPRLP